MEIDAHDDPIPRSILQMNESPRPSSQISTQVGTHQIIDGGPAKSSNVILQDVAMRTTLR
jgi:hypothetical protein